MLATVKPTTNIQGSIRTEFKRMAQVLVDVEGVENSAEALKKAWVSYMKKVQGLFKGLFGVQGL